MALHSENFKMVKDVRGIERGKCACGAHRVREQVKVQGSGKMKNWGGSRTQRENIQSSQILFCLLGQDSFLT